ncbi:hypothetical protein [Rhizobium sp. Root1203]|uniref:hypothetical protein n=1 Tax=Rhizobium sp. Root1203 TaxID=1736427 RepID=UPI001FCDAD10|nr:hypothetical protein [Rhizobium sp. Root1203]
MFSAHAERIEICLFDDGGKNETARIRCPSSPTRSGKATSRDLSRPRYMAARRLSKPRSR